MKNILFLSICLFSTLSAHAQWQTTTVDTGSYISTWCRIAVDNNNHPAISYWKVGRGLFFASYDGTVWNLEWVDTASSPIGSLGDVNDIEFDNAGFPHISYAETWPVIN